LTEHQTALKAIRDLDTTDIKDKRKAIRLIKAIARAALKAQTHHKQSSNTL
jgi:hypothetical protein